VRGVLAPVLDRFAVPFSVKHGFDSATSVKQVADATEDLERPRASYQAVQKSVTYLHEAVDRFTMKFVSSCHRQAWPWTFGKLNLRDFEASAALASGLGTSAGYVTRGD
jgi:hypothetical protein